MDNVESRVKTLVSAQFGIKENEIFLQMNFVDDLQADSLDEVELVISLEETFDLRVPDEDTPGLRTVKDVVDYVVKALA